MKPNYNKVHCSNLNHSRSSVQVGFCPTCGEKFNSNVLRNCGEAEHAVRRKAGNHYCHSCGKNLKK